VASTGPTKTARPATAPTSKKRIGSGEIGADALEAAEDVAVRGPAADDSDFTGGSDSVTYSVALPNTAGPFSMTAEFYFQSIGFRWAQNLRAYDAPEPQRFVRYYDEQAGRSSKLLASDTASAN